MRPIDATRLVKLVLEERDKIPLEVVERYSFGVPSPNKHGQSMRGGIRKVLRLIEQAPTLDCEPVVHSQWMLHEMHPHRVTVDGFVVCPECKHHFDRIKGTWFKRCPNCGAKMDGKADAHDA